ncbi:restriction endonuclease subunit S [Prevotella marseillensis]|uniref:restriction endonuclease subunit S n=1 Tax=Prevotella marseillensis TaxID=2479840 RepID=UPI000F63153D|nr:restriction endonuclease subunit S [Prevotella marseillensis]
MNGKQLKNSILQWAIQGKLVPQDPNDEPASVLLEKIREEKAKLVKEGKIRKNKKESIIYRGDDNSYYEKILATGEVKCIDEEIPFEIPTSWSWARLMNVSIYIQRGKSPKYSPIKKYPVVAQKCNQWAGFSIDKAQFIEPGTLSKYAAERILQDEDLMWNSTGLGTLGRMAVYYARLNPYELAVADSHVTVIRLFKPFMSPLFFYFYFASPTVQSVIEDKSDGSTKQKELSTTTVCNYLVPIPPRNEQTRIISKVTSLLPVIEKYGTQQEKLDKLNRTINEQIKKSVLQEAIQGKLVPQNASEGTAQELLEQIKTEKLKLVKEGKLKKSALNDSVIFRGDDNKYFEKNGYTEIDITDEIPFEIPDSWSWVRLNDICSYIQRGKSPKYSPIKKYPVVAQKCNQWSGFSIDKAQFIDPDTLSSYGEERILQNGDLMWNSTGLGTLGRMAIYWQTLNPYELAVVDSHVTVIRVMKKFVLPQYLYYYFTSHTVQSVIEKKSDGSTKQKELATATVKNYMVPIPPLMEQRRIISKIKQLASIMRG